jgi:hypothetical protein
MADIDPERLKELVAELIAEEEGQMAFGLAAARHLTAVPTETAWDIVSFVVKERSTLFEKEDGEPDEQAIKAFTEGILCGLRIRTAIATLAAQSS